VQILNRWLVRDLVRRGLWSVLVKDSILASGGSVQNIEALDEETKQLYKTTWEIKQKPYINLAADRGPYVCQSASLNLYQREPTLTQLNSMLIHAWRRGLKTLVYYLRTRSASNATQFTVDRHALSQQAMLEDAKDTGCSTDTEDKEDLPACSADNSECLACSS
jgi:ribonucleotide reductase alpha subunit